MMNTAEAAGAAGTLDMKYVLTCVLLMALVTYIPRVLPVTIFRKQIRSKFIRSFLDYTPYAVLGALTFPDVFTSTGHLYSAVGGTIVAVILAPLQSSPRSPSSSGSPATCWDARVI